jgi:methyl-accepting chemotaxis protein PixJ
MTNNKQPIQTADQQPEESGLFSSFLSSSEPDKLIAIEPTPELMSNNANTGKKFISLKTKAAIFAALMGIVPAALIGGLSIYQISEFTTKQTKSTQQERASALADKLNRFLFERYGDIEILASQPIFAEAKISAAVTKVEKNKLLDQYVESYQVYDSIAVFDLQGNPLAQSKGKELSSHADREYFKQVLATGKTYVSKPETSKSNGTVVMYFAAPIKDSVSGKVIGVVRTRAPIERVEAPVKNMAGKEASYHFYDTRNNQVFISSNKEYNGKQVDSDIQDAQSKGVITHLNSLNKRKELMSAAPFEKLPGMPSLNLVAVATYDSVEAYRARDTLLFLLLAGAGLITLATAAIGLLVAERTSKPILDAASAVEKIGQGDLHERIITNSNDEVGSLANNINTMTSQLQVLLVNQSEMVERTQLLSLVSQATNTTELAAPLSQLLAQSRTSIGADRLVIYRFTPDWGGHIVAEALAQGVASAMRELVSDPCIPTVYREELARGKVVANYNVLESGYHTDHVKLFERLGIKSNLIVPLSQNGNLVGLLVAHHCQRFHQWNNSETQVLTDLAEELVVSMLSYSTSERTQYIAEQERANNIARQRELMRLLTEIEGAATGDLTVRSEINEGEIAIVGDFFNSIIESLRDIVSTVKVSTAQVTTSVGANESEIRLLATAANTQAEQIEQTLRQVEEGSISIQSVAQSAKQAALVATAASVTAENGGRAMDNTVANINQLRETVAETAKKVKRLGESSQQISKAVGLINQIALQTNLLAINASIEAARAGEEGRGFAVVAEEVAQLATQSSAATKEIEKIVSTIQRETGEVSQAMELSTAQVVEGTRAVEQTKLSLKEIIDQSKEIDTFLKSISASAIEQVRSSEAVQQIMVGVAQVSSRTSTSSVQVSNSLQATVAITRELEAVVGKFKVNADKN